MKKQDLLFALLLLCVLFLIVSPFTKDYFIYLTTSYPYIGGFLKFAILATMGELLALRLRSGSWRKPSGLLSRAIVWGFIGIVITLIFVIFSSGVEFAMEHKYLPYSQYPLLQAFLISLIMNLIFAPTMMGFHKLTDAYIDLKYMKNSWKIPLSDIVCHVDWYRFIQFILLKTIPLFWIPAHTLTFMLPSTYRVIMAAFLSIALGLLLSFGKNPKVKKSDSL